MKLLNEAELKNQYLNETNTIKLFSFITLDIIKYYELTNILLTINGMFTKIVKIIF